MVSINSNTKITNTNHKSFWSARNQAATTSYITETCAKHGRIEDKYSIT